MDGWWKFKLIEKYLRSGENDKMAIIWWRIQWKRERWI
jgi:hypothetical protein